MNSYCDFDWFNIKKKDKEGKVRFIFDDKKSLKGYVDLKKLEITCGEAPFVISRYDTTKGNIISLYKRIGFLDRKLTAISQYIEDKEEWYEELKLPQTTLRRVNKEEAARLDVFAEDYFAAYMREVEKSKDCERSQKKQKVEKLIKGLSEESGMAITQFFLSYYDHNVTAKLCTDVLFGTKP